MSITGAVAGLAGAAGTGARQKPVASSPCCMLPSSTSRSHFSSFSVRALQRADAGDVVIVVVIEGVTQLLALHWQAGQWGQRA